ncbi:MAG: M23 family metallopeptidase [Gammaproteobacteria bacterium]|nr:M23 family metallopeptidase [Gammaproteobacteria bacterium]MDH5650731.1 M23 family metallopeptidase [Gammaproteobacteria bacterium]
MSLNIVLMTKNNGRAGLISLGKKKIIILSLGVFVVLPAAFLSIGFRIAANYMERHPDEVSMAIQTELDTHRQQIAEATRDADLHLNALALRLGTMQAQVIRMDALSQRLTDMANLDEGEFNFDQPPAQGGPYAAPDASSRQISVPDFVKELNALSRQIDDRNQQLSVLETMLMTRNLQAEVIPTGRPVTRGWLSSFFGLRADPFTGRRAHHAGVDFAGKEGSEIVTVAAGVVTYSGRRSGYGNMVEVNHGNGYFTRYGHNKENVVKVGQTVKKGDVVAIMGTTGRSTGPHVHFEVILDGKKIDPKHYIQSAL